MRFPLRIFSIFVLTVLTPYSAIASDIKNDYFDIGEFIRVGLDLYEKNGVLYFLSEKAILEDNGNYHYQQIYRKRFSYKDEDKIKPDPMLNTVIDKNSWEKISDFFYRDKKNLYCFVPSTDGGYLLRLHDADPNKHKFLVNNKWVKPENVFADSNSKSRSPSKEGLGLISWYSTDTQSVYYRCNKIMNADVNTFESTNNKSVGWTAKDKNNYYDGGRVVKE